jgi:hypothetical protein
MPSSDLLGDWQDMIKDVKVKIKETKSIKALRHLHFEFPFIKSRRSAVRQCGKHAVLDENERQRYKEEKFCNTRAPK